MKQIFLFVVLMFYFIPCYTQTEDDSIQMKNIKIDSLINNLPRNIEKYISIKKQSNTYTFGIGKIRLLMKYDSVLNILNLKPLIAANSKNYLSTKKPLLFIANGEEQFYPFPNCRNVKVVLLPFYEVNNIVLKDIYLTFFTDYLFKIDIRKPSNEYEEIIEKKYKDNSYTSSFNNGEDCTLSTGDKIDLGDKTYITTFKINDDDIFFCETLSEGRDEHCNKTYSTAFEITNKVIESEQEKCEQGAYKKNKEIETNKLESNKDF